MPLMRPFGNVDKFNDIEDIKSYFISSGLGWSYHGVVESGDPKTGYVKVKDCQSGQTVECGVRQESFDAANKSGNFNLPSVGTNVTYKMYGGTIGMITGNWYPAVPSQSRKFEDGTTGNPGFESFGDADGTVQLDIDSDFGWDLGAWMKRTSRGAKIKLLGSGIIVIKSSPFCYQYMLPAKQARLSQFLYDEERGVGYIKRRRTFFCTLPGANFNANYKMEQIDDIPSDPQAVLKEEKGFCDKPTAFNSLNHQSDLDISGHIATAITSSIEVLKARAIRRMTIAKTLKVQGTRTLFAPVYKKEERVDGTVVEQSGHTPGNPFYNLEIVKSPVGYVHIIARDPQQKPTAVFMMDAVTGSINVMANALTLGSLLQPLTIFGEAITLNAATSFTVNSPLIDLNAVTALNLQSQAAISVNSLTNDINAQTALNMNGGTTGLNAQTAMVINAPSINSYPVPQPMPPITPPIPPPAPLPIMAGIRPIIQDNSPLDEVPMD